MVILALLVVHFDDRARNRLALGGYESNTLA